MSYAGFYILIGRWLGWTGWALSVGGVIWWNDQHPFIDQQLVVLCWPLTAGVTVRPVIKFLWPLLLFLAVGEAIWPHIPFWVSVLTALKGLGVV